MNLARELNRKLYDYVSKEDIIMDPTTAALGYGIEYSFTILERIRHAALMGDPELQHPVLIAPSSSELMSTGRADPEKIKDWVSFKI